MSQWRKSSSKEMGKKMGPQAKTRKGKLKASHLAISPLSKRADAHRASAAAAAHEVKCELPRPDRPDTFHYVSSTSLTSLGMRFRLSPRRLENVIFRKRCRLTNRLQIKRRSRLATTPSAVPLGPFGEPLRATGPVARGNPCRFSTHYTDDETGLVYAKRRYYTAATGRWLNCDPIEEDGGFNLFAYCTNSPSTNYDRMGLAYTPYIRSLDSIAWRSEPKRTKDFARTNSYWPGVTTAKCSWSSSVVGKGELEIVFLLYPAGDFKMDIDVNGNGRTLREHEYIHANNQVEKYNEFVAVANPWI